MSCTGRGHDITLQYITVHYITYMNRTWCTQSYVTRGAQVLSHQNQVYQFDQFKLFLGSWHFSPQAWAKTPAPNLRHEPLGAPGSAWEPLGGPWEPTTGSQQREGSNEELLACIFPYCGPCCITPLFTPLRRHRDCRGDRELLAFIFHQRARALAQNAHPDSLHWDHRPGETQRGNNTGKQNGKQNWKMKTKKIEKYIYVWKIEK